MQDFIKNIGFNEVNFKEYLNSENKAINSSLLSSAEAGFAILKVDNYSSLLVKASGNNESGNESYRFNCYNHNIVDPIETVRVDDVLPIGMLSVETNGYLPGLPLNVEISKPINFTLFVPMCISIVAMTIEAKLYNSSEELHIYDKCAPESIIPIGTFGISDDFVPSCQIKMNAIIRDIIVNTNSFTNERYCILKTNCLGIEFDIVASKEDFDKEPMINDIISGYFYLYAN